MSSVINCKKNNYKELYKLYCRAHELQYYYDDSINICEKIPEINSFRIKLLKIRERIKGYVFYKYPFILQDKDTLNINEIYIERDYDTHSNYTVLLGSANKNLLSKHYKYARFLFQSKYDSNNGIIQLLELLPEKKVFDMRMDLSSITEMSITSGVEFVAFKKGKDEMKRVEIQNSIFKDTKGHIDLDINDIINDENQNYYVQDGAFFIAINGEFAGYSQVIIERDPKDKPYIVNFGILPNYRKHGLSKLLLNHSLCILKEKNYKYAYITVDADNKKAYNLYKKAGFQRIDTLYSYLYKY